MNKLDEFKYKVAGKNITDNRESAYQICRL